MMRTILLKAQSILAGEFFHLVAADFTCRNLKLIRLMHTCRVNIIPGMAKNSSIALEADVLRGSGRVVL